MSKKRKICLICSNGGLAGAPRHVLSVVKNLKDQFHFTVVLGEHGAIAEAIRQENVDVHIICGLDTKSGLLSAASAFLQLLRFLKKNEFDLLHLHSAKAGLIGRLVGKLWGVPVLYTVHGWSWRGKSPVKAWALRIIERCLVPFTSHFVFVDTQSRNEGLLLGINAGRSDVIYNGVSQCGYVPEPRGRLRFLMLARVDRAKDHISLLQAFEKARIRADLVLCGFGTDSPEFKEITQHHAPTCHERIFCLGEVKDPISLIQSAHVTFLISNFEALPLSILESMAAGRVVVASAVGGVPEIIEDEVNGILVNRGDVLSIANAMHKLTDHKNRQRLVAAASLNYEKRFSLMKMSSELELLYNKIVGS